MPSLSVPTILENKNLGSTIGSASLFSHLPSSFLFDTQGEGGSFAASMETRRSYRKLCTEVYDLTKPVAGPVELKFYRDKLATTKGPILEAMCGTGRLLIPLILHGLPIEGVDYSTEMLECCKEKATKVGVSPVLFRQSLETLDLPRKYETIIIAVGSFQLFTDRMAAFRVLGQLKNHLIPKGKVFIETDIPWATLCSNIDQSTRTLQVDCETQIRQTSENTVDRIRQVHYGKTLYEKIRKGQVVESEEELLDVCWYYRYEMELFLEKSGFQDIRIHDVNFELNPGGFVYEATSLN